MIREVFCADAPNAIESFYEKASLLDQLSGGHSRNVDGSGTCPADREAVGSLTWTIQPSKVVAEAPAWLVSFADAEHLVVNRDFQVVHVATLV